ncbi:hypothetical protein [Alloyangia pacifica]|uniref:hypothetical protein n=1 Tax=Alloyangia pacifica TaxID=311180 RepID=UPI000B858A69|nr:hypothetical protein [Alloyangia pacifica]
MQPVKEQSTTDTDHAADHATDHGTEGQPPAGFWRSLTGLPDPANHVAPPSIMQIRISALLEEQAEALLKELRDKAIARMAASIPPPENRPPETPPLRAPTGSDAARSTEDAGAAVSGSGPTTEDPERTATGALTKGQSPEGAARGVSPPAQARGGTEALPSGSTRRDPQPVGHHRTEPEMPATGLAERGYGADSTSDSHSFETHPEG